MDDDDELTFSDDEITVWVVDESSIHLKAVTRFGDPVELNSKQARLLGERLLRLAQRIK